VLYARSRAADYGGDPERVVIVGHSMGAFLGLEIALHPETDAEACLADGSSKPDGVIGLGSPIPRLSDVDGAAPPIWLFSGAGDGDVEGAAQRLTEAGFAAEARVLPDVTHDGITDPAAAPEIVDLIMEALDAVER
jgi:acetyl esterase/lipase